MGIILRAKCSCGYEKQLFVDRGKIAKKCKVPGLCTNCNELQSVWYYGESIECSSCKENSVVFYDQAKLQNNPEKRKYKSWGDPGKEFTLLRTKYKCPKCGDLSMKFRKIGNWD